MNSEVNFEADIAAIGQISVVPSILEVICRTTGMGFAAIARVTEHRWVACSVMDEIEFGMLPGSELEIETTFCNVIRQSGEAIVIDHVNEDLAYSGHPIPSMYGFQSYISMPIIRKDGTFFGTLCAIDPNPASVNNPQTIGMFKLFAELISFHLNAAEKLSYAEEQLQEANKTAELREQFIAILGHDLRNPVGAISSGAQLLMRMGLGERPNEIAKIIKDSSFRMNNLIENMLDFARGRLGDGIGLTYDEGCVEETFIQVIKELQSIWPGRTIESYLRIEEPVKCDGKRIAQLFSNILGNALSHGDPEKPVVVKALVENNEFMLSVANPGKKIPEGIMARLFQPFSRATGTGNKNGLGLGLYIASEIAKAHAGVLEAHSDDERTVVTLKLPVRE